MCSRNSTNAWVVQMPTLFLNSQKHSRNQKLQCVSNKYFNILILYNTLYFSASIVIIKHYEHFEFFNFLSYDSYFWLILYESYDITHIMSTKVIWINNSTANFPTSHPASRLPVPTMAIFTWNVKMLRIIGMTHTVWVI